MHTYMVIQERYRADGKLPWEVIADEKGIVRIPSSLLGMKRIVGFQKDADVQQVDVRWSEVYADPSKAVGLFLVAEHTDGAYRQGPSPVSTAGLVDYPEQLPVER